MAVLQENWKDLISPEVANVEYKDSDGKKAIITLEPLERGYGITLGNALRRILLSSIKGFAVTAVKIDGILHEYSTIDGIREDVIDIIMNIKSLILDKPTTSPATLKLKLDKKGTVFAKDIILSNNVRILNPDLVICNVEDSKVNLNVEMTVEYGMGYSLNDEKDSTEKEVSVIYLDSLFNPVKNVSYSVENARIGQHTDYDKLILEIETNGTIKPDEAVGIAAKILQAQLNVFVKFDSTGMDKTNNYNGALVQATGDDLKNILSKEIDEMELSVRSYNCLVNEGVRYIADLVQKSEIDVMRLPNFGKKSLNELKESLKSMGLSFDMKLEPDMIPTNELNEKASPKKKKRN